MNEFNAIGIMSGSSLDGLDLCCAHFCRDNELWTFSIDAFSTVEFIPSLYNKLKVVRTLSALELSKLDIALGKWIGDSTRSFIREYGLSPNLIGSHGHTVFHQVDHFLSVQIGNPHCIAESTGLPVVADFRQQNVLHGGQGAPLVPIGDLLLFPDYDVHINLGGIANLSIKTQKGIVAGDITPCNQVLNKISNRVGKPFDDQGLLAKSGSVNHNWLDKLVQHPFYKKPIPKSIANEWVNENYLQRLPDLPSADLLCSFNHFIADRISEAINLAQGKKILVTGGGAYNSFLLSLLNERLHNAEIVVPDHSLIESKEALVFAFMGGLKMSGEVNCLASYTGAKKDISAGVVYLP
jgi:anhydro-N-acetylmuramic acid kinase